MNAASRSYYRRFYRLAGLAVAVMTGVLTGSLVLGDSVRGSLTDRVDERLGNTETIVQTGTGFLSDSILGNELLTSAKGFLLVEGFVSAEGRMVPVTVWGGDEESLGANDVLLNEELKKEIGLGTVILHLPSNSIAPAKSPFISQNYTTQIRLHAKGVKDGKDGGNLLLHNEQMRPLNIFMKRECLAEAMGLLLQDDRQNEDGNHLLQSGDTMRTKGPMNVILSERHFTADDFRRSWHPSLSGIQRQGDVVSSSRVFLPRHLTDSLHPKARYLAYFVNSLGPIPYSFVTATDQLEGDNAVLSDYAARRMGAHVGDSVTMEYYVVKGLKRLETRSHRFIVSQIVPIQQMADSLLTASFPGLSNVDRCTDWDSDLPIDMGRITKADEDYWTNYRQTPKALVSLDAVGDDWEGEYGVATKVVTSPERMERLTPESMGIMVVQPRAAALRAAQNGTDFASLFLSLGFFIILAAILLMQNPLMEMYLLRHDEIQLYTTLGFKRGDVFKRLYAEALPTLLIATPVGLVCGYAYAALMLWLMAGIWNGATHTDGFTIHAHPATIFWAWLASMLIGLAVLWLTVRKGLKQKPYTQARGKKGKWLLVIVFSITAALIVANFIALHSMMLFIVCGLMWMICCGMIGQAFVNRETDDTLHPLPVISHLRHYQRQYHLAFWTLAAGVFAVFAVGLNRPDANHYTSYATGEYQLFAESHVPIQYNLNDAASRRHLSLTDLDDDTHFLQLAKHTEDEASCWNLNQVSAPSVLGMDMKDMADFGIDTTRFANHAALSVAIDDEALLWSMMKKTGDTLTYTSNNGRATKVVIATSYPTGVFHGNAIMPMEQFRSMWPDETGSKVILVKTGEEKQGNPNGGSPSMPVASLLSSALGDYGLTVSSTADRLRRFFEVTDAYLSIFMSLGGMGLLLGLASLLIVIRKNMAARRQETELYKTLGFTTDSIVRMFRREQSIVPLYAIFSGTTGSLISISANVRGVSPSIWLFALALLLLLLFTTMIIIQISINPKTIQKMKQSLILVALFICAACSAQPNPAVTGATQSVWVPQDNGASVNGWRGPNNNGSYPDKGLLAQWPADGPEKIFEVEDAGKGYSSPQVVGDRIYLTGLNDQEDQEVLNCYKLDGTKVYTVPYGRNWNQSYPETRTTPTYSDGKIYVISGMGDIVCLNAEDGAIVWKVDGGEKYARKTGNWGTSECPLVFDDKVIYTPCGDQTTMVALNKNTGEEIWKTRALGDKSGYVSPILIKYKGKRQIVGSTSLNAFGVDPETGEIEWTFDNWGPKYTGKQSRWDNIAPNSALYRDGKIFFCHGYDINGFQLKLADDLKSVEVTWRTDVLDTHHGGYVLEGDYIYGSNWINNNAGNWCCLDWNTGEVMYETAWQGKGKGSIITADNKLICYDERRGTVGLAKATPEKFEIISEFRITKGSGPYWAHPSIANGVLYIRHANAFYAYKIK